MELCYGVALGKIKPYALPYMRPTEVTKKTTISSPVSLFSVPCQQCKLHHPMDLSFCHIYLIITKVKCKRGCKNKIRFEYLMVAVRNEPRYHMVAGVTTLSTSAVKQQQVAAR